MGRTPESFTEGEGSRIEFPRSSEIGTHNIVVVTDLEGPHIIQDTARQVFTRFLQPRDERKNNTADYGGIIFDAIYEWYTEKIHNYGYGEEGSDMAYPGVLLLAYDVSQIDLIEEASKSIQTPGSAEWINKIHKTNGILIGVTTAWEEAHRPIAKRIGLDDLKGTKFPIDELRTQWQFSDNWEEERRLVECFLNDCFEIINRQRSGDTTAQAELKTRFSQFYLQDLGVVYRTEERIRAQGYKTYLAKIIENMDVVGDQGKAKVSREINGAHNGNGALHAVVGDGNNDCLMLQDSFFSIALNGHNAAMAADVAIISANVSITGDVIVLRLLNPHSSIPELIKLAQQSIPQLSDGRAVLHEGGANIDGSLINQHKEMRRKIRGVGANIP